MFAHQRRVFTDFRKSLIDLIDLFGSAYDQEGSDPYHPTTGGDGSLNKREGPRSALTCWRERYAGRGGQMGRVQLQVRLSIHALRARLPAAPFNNLNF